MLKRLIILVAFLSAFVIGVSAQLNQATQTQHIKKFNPEQSGSATNSTPPESREHQQGAANQKKDSPKPSAIVSQNKPKKEDNPARTGTENKNDELEIERQLAKSTEAIASFTLCLVLVTVFLGLIAIGQGCVSNKAANAAKKSAAIAEKTLTSIQRPWVKIENAKITWIILGSTDSISLHINFQFKNVGTTPARDVKFSVEEILMDSDPHMNISEKVRNICGKAKSRDMGFPSYTDLAGYLFPNETSIEHSISANFSHTSFERDTGEKIEYIKTLLIVVCVIYKYTFDNTVHTTGMPYRLTRKDFTPISPAQEDDSFINNADGIPTDMRSISADKLSFERIWDSCAD